MLKGGGDGAMRKGRKASDRCGSGFWQGSVWKTDTGRTRVKQQWSRVKTKNEGDMGLKQGNVATFQRMLKINVAMLDINVATFQRRSKSTSRRSRGG